MNPRRFLLLVWRVLVANRQQCREPLWAKLKLIADEIHPARSFAAFRGPFYRVAARGGVEAVLRDPAGLEQLLKEGVHVGTHFTLARRWHAIAARDRAFPGSSREANHRAGGRQ